MLVLDWAEFAGPPSDRRGKPSAMTIGVFDGVHRGHQALIRKVVERGPFPTVITFRQNPKSILNAESYEGDILSPVQKLECLEALGVERAILIDFSGNFSKLKGREFIDTLKNRGNLVFLAIGRNFRCGYKLDTDAACIQAIGEAGGIAIEVIPPLGEGHGPVSSTRIRSAILKGNMEEASCLLGRNVVLDLRGIQGEKREEGFLYKPALRNRVFAREGSFPVVLYRKDSSEGQKMEIRISGEGVCIPLKDDCSYIECIEFISGQAVSKN
ncbi:MAG: FAD synthetase family protein [Treponema sp.]|jgi:riboflavin kinase/FMN adenylyltransferase|nr:FAD synthetase family protein [Treponema sp.]